MLKNYKISGVFIAITLFLITSIACTAKPKTTPTYIDDSFSMLTPYVNASNMASINEAFSSTSNAPWGFEHNGIDFCPNGNYKPFQAVASGTVENIEILQIGNWMVNVRIRINPTYCVIYGFEPFSSNQADGDTQRANILVSEGQSVAQGDIIGNLFVVDTEAAHVHFMLQKNWVGVCPEPYFTASARASISDLIHKDHPTWNMCYNEGSYTSGSTPTTTQSPESTATADKSEYNLTVYICNGEGEISPSAGIYAKGTSVTITATPASGWHLDHWEYDAGGSENPLTILMDSDKHIGACFDRDRDTPPSSNPTSVSTPGLTPGSTLTPIATATSAPSATTPTPTSTANSISMLTPYVNSSDMESINEAFSSTSSAPWGFQHTGIDFFPAGNYKPFQAVASGTVENISLFQNTGNSNWQVNVRVRLNPTYIVYYAFEPASSNQADGETQLANIFVSEGQNVAQGDLIGNLLEVDTGAAHVDWQLQQNWVCICPEPYFTAAARDSILDLIHKNNPTWNICY